MATHPRISDNERYERGKPRLVAGAGGRQRRGRGIAGPLLAAFLVALALAGTLYLALRTPKEGASPAATQVSGPPVPGELQIEGVQVITGPTPQSLYLDGRITNTGGHAVTGIVAEVKLRGRSNEVVVDVQRPLVGRAVERNDQRAHPFAAEPILPKQTRPFRIVVEQVPIGWNNNLPEVQVVGVTAQGAGE